MFNNNFQPEKNDSKVPYFDEVTSSEGWEGHATTKSIEKLKQEIAENFTLIGCLLTGFQMGRYGDRYGFQIHFAMKSPDGKMLPSRLDIACLPVNPNKRTRRTNRRTATDWRIEATQKMALYMTAKAIKGMYFLNVLSPAYIPFLSLMLNSNNETLGQIWIHEGGLSPLLPPPSSRFEGDVVEGELA